MKINGTNRIDYVNQAYKKNSENVAGPEKRSTFVKPQDTIELSEASKELRKQIENLSTVETTDRQKIDAIKQAIQNGTYKVSPKELSDSMIDKMMQQKSPSEE